MAPDGERKRGNIQLVHRTPEELLDLEFREAIAALEVARGRRRPRRFAKVAGGERHPMRVPARLISDALAARIPGDVIIGAIHRSLKHYVARKTRTVLHDTGEFRPAA